MKKIFSLIFASSLFLFSTLPVGAISLHAADNIVITDPVTDDAYVIAGNATMRSGIDGDLYIMGGNINIDGDITEDLVVGGGKVVVAGNILGDIRILGGQVAIYGNVGDDILVAAGQVDIGNTAVVEGSLVSGSGILTIDGVVKEDIKGVTGMFLLNGAVDGDVNITIEDAMNISDQASIGGDFDYSAILEGTVPAGVVKGQVKYNEFEINVEDELKYMSVITKVFSYFASVLLLLLVIIFSPKPLMMSAMQVRDNFVKTLGVGLLSVMAVIVGSVILMTSVIGIPLAVMTLAGFLIVFYLSQVFVVAWAGSYLLNYKKKLSKVRLFFVLAIVMLVYQLLGWIPTVGWIINLLFFLVGTGAIVLVEWEYVKILKKGKKL